MTLDETKILPRILPDHLYNSNIRDYISAFITVFNLVDKDIISMRDNIFVSTATGRDLDIIGNFFGLKRNQGESDSNFRNRILSYFQSLIKGGSIEGLSSAIRAITGVEVDNLVVTDAYHYKPRLTYDFLSGTDYTGTGVTNDTSNYVEIYGKSSIKTTNTIASNTRTALNSSPSNLTQYAYGYLSFYFKSASVTDLSSLKLIITDTSANTLEYEKRDFSDMTDDEWIKITIDLSEYDIDYDNIDSVQFQVTGENSVVSYIDHLFYEEYVPSGKFSIDIDIGDETNLNKYDNIPTIMALMKPVGIEFEEFVVNSTDGIFRYNLSKYNSLDSIV